MAGKKPKKRSTLGSVFFVEEKNLWVVQVDLGRDSEGKRKRVRKYAKTELEAEKLKAALITDHGRGVAKDPKNIICSDWINDFVSRKNQRNTNTTKKEDARLLGKILPVIGHLKVQTVQPMHIRDVLTATRDAAPRTQRKILQLLKGAFDEAVVLDVIHRNPVLAVKLPKEKPEPKGAMWEPHEVHQFLQTLQKDRYYYIYRIALGIGARIGEIQALKVSDFDVVSGTLTIQRTVSGRPYDPEFPLQITSGKTFNATRTITLPADLHQELREWRHSLLRRASKEGWLFASQTGGLIPYVQIWKHFKQARERAGVSDITIHDMRRTFINLCARAGTPLEVVAKIVGHGDWSTITKIYRMVHENEMRKHTPQLSQLLGVN